LYNDLSDFDKIPLKYSRLLKPSRGRFGPSKNNNGHVGQETMRRFQSLLPTKSRIVEAICLRLSLEIKSPDKHLLISRYGKIVNRYNQIRMRIMDCPSVLEKTGFSLFPFNETRVNLWKNLTNLAKVRLLLALIFYFFVCFKLKKKIRIFKVQLLLPNLLLANEREMYQGQPSNPFVFVEPEDIYLKKPN
jgi:hypothetical protein